MNTQNSISGRERQSSRNKWLPALLATVVVVGGLGIVSANSASAYDRSRDSDRAEFERRSSTTSANLNATSTTAAARTGATPTTAAARPEILGNTCRPSDLQRHDGFQNAPRCVSTAFGEVSAQDKNPSLLITNAPERVNVNQAFTIRVSTRNLVRDRFLGAAAGGYYLESSYLTDQGLQRGHFHTACRMLASTNSAPDPAPVPAFFKATEDGGGGSRPDTVEVTVTGLPTAGTAQCAVWAGDGSHRVPMMQRANQTPAFDVVRIRVGR